MTDKAGYPQAAFGGDRFGKRRVPKMYAEVNRLREAIRAHDADATEAAWDAVEQHIDFAYQKNAAPAPAQAWRVKPLEWHKSHVSGWNDDWHTVPTAYTIRCTDENGWKWSSQGAFGYSYSPEAAKAAAQADYAARILAALIPDTEVGA